MNTPSDSITDRTFDVCVIGAGINGAGIARDAVGRGLSVLLLEKDDIGEGTSSRSGKLIHGGLRYLENYEFRLVREALIEREVLLASAPHIIWPMRFVLPHSAEDRPAWLVRAGLFLYDHLGGRKRLPPTRSLNLRTSLEGECLKPVYRKAFEYSDCWVDDSRLVILNALDAHERGAVILSRTEFQSADRHENHWSVAARNCLTSETITIKAKCLINAAGPWVNDVLSQVDSVDSKRRVRLVKGSHIVVKKFWEGSQAYLIQNNDKRVIFINPYEGDKALIGTTDIPYEGDPGLVEIDDGEIDYLLKALNRYFTRQLRREDILQSFSGVRPLYDDNSDNPSTVTRDYLFDINTDHSGAPFLSVFGGKITTFRKLSEHAIDKLAAHLPEMSKAWTSEVPLPGGDIDNADFNLFLNQQLKQYPKLDPELIKHYAQLYGTRIAKLLNGVDDVVELGRSFSRLLFEKEVRYLIENEWALTAEDVLVRRTKHGLHMHAHEITSFQDWFKREFPQNEIAVKCAS